VREKGFRQGFTIEDLRTGEKLIFASVEQISKIKFGKYFLNIKNFEKIALIAFENAQIVLIDEIGKMEFYSRSFKYYLFKNLEKDINLIATLHRDFVKDFSRYEILALTRENYSDIKKPCYRKTCKIQDYLTFKKSIFFFTDSSQTGYYTSTRKFERTSKKN